MSIRGKPWRRRGSVAARLLAVGALVASLAGSVVLAGAAAADTDCPTFQAVGFTWSTQYQGGGVTLCSGIDVDTNEAALQIIDLSAGAKIRVASAIDEDSAATAPKDDTRFIKRGVSDWMSFVRNGLITDPSPDQIFSVMNASFFVDTGILDDTTRLSMPEMVDYSARTLGWAHHEPGAGETRDAAWDVAKRRLLLSTPYPPFAPPAPQNQYAAICSFPTHYGSLDALVYANFCNSLQYKDVIVGFEPLAGVDGNPEPPSADPRTMVGWDGGSKIFTVQFPSATLNETQAFLQSLGSTMEIQLDGGCSAQLDVAAQPGYGGWSWQGEDIPAVCPRPVPDALVVYTSS